MRKLTSDGITWPAAATKIAVKPIGLASSAHVAAPRIFLHKISSTLQPSPTPTFWYKLLSASYKNCRTTGSTIKSRCITQSYYAERLEE